MPHHPPEFRRPAFVTRCGLRPGAGSAGDAHDNAMAGAVFATLWCWLRDPGATSTYRREARLAEFHCIEGHSQEGLIAVRNRPCRPGNLNSGPDLHPATAFRAAMVHPS